MSGIPPLPPLRIKESDGSPNVIPVFQMTLSNITLTNQGGGKVLLDGAGGTGPTGPAGTLTIGSGITGGATDGFILIVSDGSILGQIDSGTFQRAISFPISIASGGTARTTAGSAHTLLGVNSDGSTLSYYAVLGSNNATVTKSGTSITISANTATPIVYAATGNKYVVMDLAGDLSAEHRLVQSGNNISITTASGLVTINATTADISGKQDSLNIPIVIGSGGTGTVSAGSATQLVGMNSSDSSYSYYNLIGSNSTIVTRSANSYVISTVTSGAAGPGGGNGVVNAGSAGNLAYYVQAGTAVDDLVIGSATTILGVNSSGASHDYYHILASDNATIVKLGTAIYISANTGAGGSTDTSSLVQNSRTINTTYPLSGGGDLTADRTFAIQTGGAGQVLITSGGASGDVAWVNTLGGASGAVYAATGNNYAVLNFATDLTNEYRLVQSGNSITISTAQNLIIINAVTNAAGAGGTKVIEFPMALMTVEIRSANAIWQSTGGGGFQSSFFDDAYVTFIDSGQGVATWWTKMPRNLNDTPAWNIVIDSKRRDNVGIDTGLILSVGAISIAHGESSFRTASTILVSAGTFKVQSSGILTVSTMTDTDFDGTLPTSAGDLLKVQLTRHGNADGLQTDWDVYSVNVRATVDS